MKKKLSLMLVALLVISTMFGGSVLATTPEEDVEPINYDPGDGSRWYFNQDFTKVVVDGVEYDNLILTGRQPNGRVYILNYAIYDLAVPREQQRLDISKERYAESMKFHLEALAKVTPGWELLYINHEPWQDTEYADFYIEQLRNVSRTEYSNPRKLSNQEILEFLLDKDNLGLSAAILYEGVPREQATPVEMAYIMVSPQQGLARSEMDLPNHGGYYQIGNHKEAVIPIRFGDFMAELGRPLNPEKPLVQSIIMYIGSNQIEKGREAITLDVAPYIRDSSTLIPLRGAMEALDANVHWNAKDDSVKVTKGEDVLLFKFGSLIAYVNGEAKTLPAQLERLNNRIMIPLRFLSENLGYTVNWYGSTQMIEILDK